MTTHPIQTLFDNVIDRQIADMPYLTADRQPANRSGRNNDELIIARLVDVMPAGETMRLCDLVRDTNLSVRLIRGVMERSKEFQKVGRGKWIRGIG